MGLSLNIDMSARAFYENKLVSEFVKEFLNKDQERIKGRELFKELGLKFTMGIL
ncbi:hypothetical protein HanXRQr2_Chr05g0200631 [Helianthus annuus]|uniref:Uncharacterized protein n=1 Tax=Helianthus annuus TaxID=4232 RepID=A0A9K3IY08_HELAN|nr:hypothetical protein HanXRQr2_Chr05g0200631 [Helianthus annuus]